MPLSIIISNEVLSAGFYHVTVRVPADFCSPLPGQFVQVLCSTDYDPLLRRPFSVCTYSRAESSLSIVYQVVGVGTQYLASLGEGDAVDLLGPLGGSFPEIENAEPVLVGGGVGVPPMVMLASWLISERNQRPDSITMLQGARSKSGVLCEEMFEHAGVVLEITTDDGSYGNKGLVTDMLRAVLVPPAAGRTQVIYACGPYPMLKAVADIARAAGTECYVSMEAPMPCGFGVCMGCVVPTRHGYLRCCREGPVFNAADICW